MDRTAGITPIKIPYNRSRLERLFNQFAVNAPDDCVEEYFASQAMRELVDLSIKRLNLKKNDIVLDAGTGPGRIALQIASSCRWVVGIDISRAGLERARLCAEKRGISNVTFIYSALEEKCNDLDLSAVRYSKILVLRSLHHLPDLYKKRALVRLVSLLNKPGRLVIGDHWAFKDINVHQNQWSEVLYDGGVTDYISDPYYIAGFLQELGLRTLIDEIHPLAGVITAKW